MIVSHRHRFIFLKTRKTAGTSVEIALSTVCGPDDIVTPIADEDEELRRAIGGVGPQNYQSPPLDREATNHMPARRARQILPRDVWRGYFKFSIERNPWDAVVSLYYWVYKDRDPVPFEEFMRQPRIVRLAELNARNYRIGGKIVVDRVLRQESLESDLREVWRRLDLPGAPTLPLAKGGVRPAGGYRHLYNPETAEIVRREFAHAIRDFGYEF